MSEIKALDKLREYQLCDEGERYTAYIGATEIANEIEAEINERYMLLPVDVDGGMSEYIYEHKPSGADHMGKPVELPTLVQREEIVRCRDCKNYRGSDTTCHSLKWGNWGKGIVAEPDGFCAWGERWLDEL